MPLPSLLPWAFAPLAQVFGPALATVCHRHQPPLMVVSNVHHRLVVLLLVLALHRSIRKPQDHFVFLCVHGLDEKRRDYKPPVNQTYMPNKCF